MKKFKAYKFKGTATDGSITRTVVALDRINGHDVALIGQWALCSDHQDWHGYEKLYTYKERHLIYREIGVKLDTLLKVVDCVRGLIYKQDLQDSE